jgi:uncharacterized protein
LLTVDHVKLRRRKGLLEVEPLCGVARGRALELAGAAVDVARLHEGEPRAALEEALDELPLDGSAREARLGRGLKKLILDACAFDVDSALPPAELRSEVFAEAARQRAQGAFHRQAVLEAVGAARGVAADEIERALYADLSAAHAVSGFDVADGPALVARYETGELQAVLLRATRLVADVEGAPTEIRALLRAAKLHQLLFEVEPGEHGVRLTLDGPMALFSQSTRYGLKLALLLPALLACARVRLEADVRIRKEAGVERLVLEAARAAEAAPPPAPEVVQELFADLERAGPPWRPRPALDILHLPGSGALVPDLELVHDDSGEIVYVEVLGFWSRAAVWKRVELVERGLPVRVVFCASERLRVSEEALPADAGGALVVFKGALRAARVREAADRVTARALGR